MATPTPVALERAILAAQGEERRARRSRFEALLRNELASQKLLYFEREALIGRILAIYESDIRAAETRKFPEETF